MSSLKPCMSKMEKFIGPLESEGVPKPSKGDAATGLKVAKPEAEKSKLTCRENTRQAKSRSEFRHFKKPF